MSVYIRVYTDLDMDIRVEFWKFSAGQLADGARCRRHRKQGASYNSHHLLATTRTDHEVKIINPCVLLSHVPV